MPHVRLKPDFALDQDRINELKKLVPEAFADGQINWDALRGALGQNLEEEGEGAEHFGLNWPGKRKARQTAFTPSTGTLVPAKGEGVNEDETQNIFIEGENLEVLKLLQKSYEGKIKMIYIDPPYNTGDDLIYNDTFSEPLKEYLRYSGQLDDEGRALTTNTRADGRFHSRWLSMMYPRLHLARNLLREDGVLLVSINDIEGPKLRMLLDEIFGEASFVAQFVWNNEGNVDQQSKVKGVHEYILCYSRNPDKFDRPVVIDPNIEETSKLFNDEIENSITKNGPANPPSTINLPTGFPAVFEKGDINIRKDKWPNILDPIKVSKNKLVSPARVHSGWSSRNLLELFIRNGCVPIKDSEGKETRFALTESGAIYGYKKRSESQGHVISVIRNVGTTKQNSSMLEDWGLEFDYPKPVLLIQYLLEIFTAQDANAIVLDFFGGSATTAHALIRMNLAAPTAGQRQFILVQLPEPIDNKKFPNISKMSQERIRRAIKYELAEVHQTPPKGSAEKQGFRVFKLEQSCFRQWADYPGGNVNELEQLFSAHADPLRENWKQRDLLAEILLQEGVQLTAAIRKEAAIKKNDILAVHSNDRKLLICLDEKLYADSLEAITLGESDTLICLDSALTDEQKLRLADKGLLKTI
jgi:adenine-specific DNA-methyltransferase